MLRTMTHKKVTAQALGAALWISLSACATDPEPVAPTDPTEAPAEHQERPTAPVATAPIPDDPSVTQPDTPAAPPTASVDPIQVTIFNRFMVKPKQQDLPEGEIKAIVEDSVGAKVIKLRRTAVRYWLVQLEPASPPRGAAEQKAIVAKLQGCGAFDVVEGDQLMTIK